MARPGKALLLRTPKKDLHVRTWFTHRVGCRPAFRRSGGGLLTAGPATALSGSDAPGSGYAFAAKLNVGDKASCSGALVDAQWVITAASCFRNGSAAVPAGKPALKTTVTVGRTDLTQSTGTVVEAAELVPHADRDLVMVKLAWRVVGVEPVKVATTAPLAGEQLTSLGFGRTKTEWVPDKAHTGVFTVASVDGGTLGLNASGGAVVCKGDAGGPALRQTDGGPELAAVNSRSWQGGCLGTDAAETRTGALDVRVDDVAAWVDQVRKTTPAVRLASVVPNVTKVMGTGDFNQDGRTDIAAVTTDGNLHTFAGRPDGTFEYGRPLWRADGSWGAAKKIIGGDFNGDGFTDIASVWSNGALRLYAGRSDGSLADGKAMWADASTNWDAMRQLDRYRAPGSDRDGLIAVWGTGDAKGSLHAYSTTADGVLTSQSRKMWPDNTWLGIQKITTGDFNNDGRDDVVAIASDGALRRYSGDAAGGLDTGVSMWHDTAWNNMPVLLSGDFNGDGKTDLGGLWSNQQRFNFYRGNGQGAVAPGANAWPSPPPARRRSDPQHEQRQVPGDLRLQQGRRRPRPAVDLRRAGRREVGAPPHGHRRCLPDREREQRQVSGDHQLHQGQRRPCAAVHLPRHPHHALDDQAGRQHRQPEHQQRQQRQDPGDLRLQQGQRRPRPAVGALLRPVLRHSELVPVTSLLGRRGSPGSTAPAHATALRKATCLHPVRGPRG